MMSDVVLFYQMLCTESKKNYPLREAFNGNGNAIQYLARYAYRTAISNSRITDVTEESVTFRYKDYAEHGISKPLEIKILITEILSISSVTISNNPKVDGRMLFFIRSANIIIN